MSSAATRNNANEEAGSTRGRRVSGRARVNQQPDEAPPPQELEITMVFGENEDMTKLKEDKTVKVLKNWVKRRFNIPLKDQFIFGWPVMEPSDDSMLLRDLLSQHPNICLHVATTNSGVEDNPGSSQSGRGGRERSSTTPPGIQPAVQGTSSQSQSLLWQPQGNVGTRNEVVISVSDLQNDQLYDGIPYEGSITVREFKRRFAELTQIPFEVQEWSGWPENLSDDCLLQNAGLDTPIHALILFENANIPPEADMDIPPDGEDEIRHEAIPVPASTGPPSPAAPVSVTPATAVNAKNNAKRPLPVPLPDEHIVDDGEMPSTSQSYVPPAAPVSPTVFIASVVEPTVADEGCATPTKKARKEEKVESPPGKVKSLKKRGESALLKFLGQGQEDKDKEAVKKLVEYLDPVSQLSLRRVCKTTKNWIIRNGDDLSRKEEEKWSRFRLTVTGIGMKSFETVVNMNLPITRYKLDVWGELFYERMDLQTFIAFLGSRVTEITLTRFFMFQNPNELALFNSFTRLEKLIIDELVVPDAPPYATCPDILSNLKVLKLNYEIIAPENNSLIRPRCWEFTWGMLADCASLMYFRFPRVKENEAGNAMGTSDGIFTPLMNYISERERAGGVAIDVLDLKHYSNLQSSYINRFVALLRKCHSKEIKMKNVHALVVQQVLDDDGEHSDNKYLFCESVISLINYTKFVENAPLSNLEKITFDGSSVTEYFSRGRQYKDIFWPKLTTIKIKDSSSIQQRERDELKWKSWQELQEDLYGHNGLFHRKSVRYIKIDSPKVPYFLSEGRLAECFTNLTRLEITAWFENDRKSVLNKRLAAIFKRLKLLELTIKNCPRLNDDSFIGEDDEDDEDDIYVFHHLRPTLRKMTLGLDGVKDVTDASFGRVFSYMKLRTFIVLSSEPTNVIEISEAAILKMQKRSFGEHIEYFPFHCWSSSKIDPQRFVRLGKKFRSLR